MASGPAPQGSAVAPAFRSSGMPTGIVSSSLPTPLGSGASSTLLGSGGSCVDHSDCTSCLEAVDISCFWCYESESCTAFATPSLASGLRGLDPFGGCSDFTLVAKQCKCRYTECGACAQAAHPSCIWVEDTTLTTTIRYVPPTGTAQQTSETIDLGGQCVDGSGLGASELEGNLTVFASDLLGAVSVAYQLTPGRWFWAQCSVPGAALAVVLGLAVLAGVVWAMVTVGYMTYCCWDCKKSSRREGYESVK